MDEYRRLLYEAHHSASRDYDQAILTLSSATLALSVTFAHDITPEPREGTLALLFLAWTSLATSLVAMVLSFLTSQRVLLERIREIDDPEAPPAVSRGRFSLATERLNWISGIGLVLGLGLLGCYAIANM